jgi:hypothetical protein
MMYTDLSSIRERKNLKPTALFFRFQGGLSGKLPLYTPYDMVWLSIMSLKAIHSM